MSQAWRMGNQQLPLDFSYWIEMDFDVSVQLSISSSALAHRLSLSIYRPIRVLNALGP